MQSAMDSDGKENGNYYSGFRVKGFMFRGLDLMANEAWAIGPLSVEVSWDSVRTTSAEYTPVPSPKPC